MSYEADDGLELGDIVEAVEDIEPFVSKGDKGKLIYVKAFDIHKRFYVVSFFGKENLHLTLEEIRKV